MDLRDCLRRHQHILMEGALGERLKREYGLSFDPNIAMAALLRSKAGADALTELWNGYIDIARRYRFPFLATTPTRRANQERLALSGYTESLIAENTAFLQSLRKNSGIEMYAGGLMGCRGDAYTGEGALSEEDALVFHSWTAEQFCRSGVDFLYAGILPTLPEAAGLARAVSHTGLPYLISFTIESNGCLIDGTPIAEAIRYIDSVTTENMPVCYMTNCVHPRIVRRALSHPCNSDSIVRQRFRGIQANTSPLSYARLDGAVDLHCTEPETLAEEMAGLMKFGFQIWGGCCGTDNRHMEAIARKLRQCDPI